MPPAPRTSSLIQNPDLEEILADLQRRIARLERYPNTAHYEIKVTADNDTFEIIDKAFDFIIPLDIDTFYLTDAQAFVSEASSSIPVSVQVRKIREGDADVDMLGSPIVIDVGSLNSYTSTSPRFIEPTTSQVLTQDQIAIDIDASGNAEGLGVVLVFAST